MEPRAAIGDYDTVDRRAHARHHQPEPARRSGLLMGAFVLSIPEHKLRVSRPMSAAASAPRSTTTPRRRSSPGARRRSAGRSSGSPNARRASSRMPMAATTSPTPSWRSTRTARSIALTVDTLANLGAYLSTFAPCVPTWLHGTLLAGQYTTPAIYVNVKAVFTNTVPVDAYRGAGRPEATYLLERMMSKAAARDGRRSGRVAAEELHPPTVPLPDAGRRRLRHRRLRGVARQGDGDLRLQGLRGAPCRRQGARAVYAASAWRATSRRAASRRRASSARSAPAPDCTRPRPSA